MRKECWWCLFQLQRVSALHYSFVYRVKIIKKMRSRTTRGAISSPPINERKEKEKTLEQPIPPNAKHTLDGGM